MPYSTTYQKVQQALSTFLCCVYDIYFSPLSCVAEGKCNPVTLEMVSGFAYGASAVPPPGLPRCPQTQFLYKANKIFPEANTCLIILCLPIHNDYDTFMKYMTEGILQAPCFGVV